MAKIAGVKLIKNAKGEVTHATLAIKHHRQYLEDMIDAAELAKARVTGESEPWEEARKKINNKFKFKN